MPLASRIRFWQWQGRLGRTPNCACASPFRGHGRAGHTESRIIFPPCRLVTILSSLKGSSRSSSRGGKSRVKPWPQHGPGEVTGLWAQIGRQSSMLAPRLHSTTPHSTAVTSCGRPPPPSAPRTRGVGVVCNGQSAQRIEERALQEDYKAAVGTHWWLETSWIFFPLRCAGRRGPSLLSSPQSTHTVCGGSCCCPCLPKKTSPTLLFCSVIAEFASPHLHQRAETTRSGPSKARRTRER